jgi:hypothetical protein
MTTTVTKLACRFDCAPIELIHAHYTVSLVRESRGQTLGRNWDKSLKSFPPCYSQSPLLTDYPTSLEQKWFEPGLNVNIVHENLKSETLRIMHVNLNEIVRS